jgi:Ca-activated chloride channel family protein
MSMRFEVETDRRLIANGSMTRHVVATIVAPEGTARQRPPVNLGLVIDRSGSMGGDKIRLAKDAAVAAIRRLDARDRFCVVTFDDHVDVVVPSTAVTGRATADAVRAIMSIQARGSTDLCGGWLRCCEQVALALSSEAVTRVLLLTDGLANRGVTNADEIVGHAAELRRRGVSTTTIGVGADFDEHLLGRMADEGGGHFYFVRHDEEIPGAIETEVGESLEVTMRGAQIRVGPADLAHVAPLANFPTRREGNEWVIEVGDLVSLQELSVPVKVSFVRATLAGPIGSEVRLSFTAAGASVTPVSSEIAWTIVSGPEVGAQARNRIVDRAVAEAYVALSRREAGRLNRDGDFTAARFELEGVAHRISGYAGDDPVLRALVDELEREALAHEEQLSPMALKMRYMTSERSLKGRDARGGATRRPNRPGDSA